VGITALDFGAGPQAASAVRPLRPDDWPAVERIYAAGIAGGNATFEMETPTWEAWDAVHLAGHRLVAVQGGQIAGWAALAPVSTRPCYSGIAENSVYVAPEAQGRGVGTTLLERLVTDAELAGIWTIQTGIFPENEVSLALHRRCGFRIVGIRASLARLDGRWRDVVFLERRSEVIR
jgi:L-amino acid N-acyltransferase YncA